MEFFEMLEITDKVMHRFCVFTQKIIHSLRELLGGSESNSRGNFQRPATAQCGLRGCRLSAFHCAATAQALPLFALRPPKVMQRFFIRPLDGYGRRRTICPNCPNQL